jgi:hypothetical protein
VKPRARDIVDSVDLRSILPSDLGLRETGRDRFRGRCPISEHTRPGSFEVQLSKRGHFVWRCYVGCGSGDVVNLYAALERITLREAIRKLSSGIPELSDEGRLTRAGDDIERSRRCAYLLVCDACGRTKPIESEIDAVMEMAGNTTWEVSPDGTGAACSNCLAYGKPKAFHELHDKFMSQVRKYIAVGLLDSENFDFDGWFSGGEVADHFRRKISLDESTDKDDASGMLNPTREP